MVNERHAEKRCISKDLRLPGVINFKYISIYICDDFWIVSENVERKMHAFLLNWLSFVPTTQKLL